MRRIVHVVLLAAALGAPAFMTLAAEDAYASVAYASPYTFEQTFGTALRLVRVDLGCKITEKDADNGYLLFEYTSPESGKEIRRGSIEIVRAADGAHVSVQLPSLPRYHEQMIVDALSRKLLAEHGEPPPRAKPPPLPESDGGTASDGAP
jgi:hypothetical protein